MYYSGMYPYGTYYNYDSYYTYSSYYSYPTYYDYYSDDYNPYPFFYDWYVDHYGFLPFWYDSGVYAYDTYYDDDSYDTYYNYDLYDVYCDHDPYDPYASDYNWYLENYGFYGNYSFYDWGSSICYDSYLHGSLLLASPWNDDTLEDFDLPLGLPPSGVFVSPSNDDALEDVGLPWTGPVPALGDFELPLNLPFPGGFVSPPNDDALEDVDLPLSLPPSGGFFLPGNGDSLDDVDLPLHLPFPGGFVSPSNDDALEDVDLPWNGPVPALGDFDMPLNLPFPGGFVSPSNDDALEDVDLPSYLPPSGGFVFPGNDDSFEGFYLPWSIPPLGGFVSPWNNNSIVLPSTFDLCSFVMSYYDCAVPLNISSGCLVDTSCFSTYDYSSESVSTTSSSYESSMDGLCTVLSIYSTVTALGESMCTTLTTSTSNYYPGCSIDTLYSYCSLLTTNDNETAPTHTSYLYGGPIVGDDDAMSTAEWCTYLYKYYALTDDGDSVCTSKIISTYGQPGCSMDATWSYCSLSPSGTIYSYYSHPSDNTLSSAYDSGVGSDSRLYNDISTQSSYEDQYSDLVALYLPPPESVNVTLRWSFNTETLEKDSEEQDALNKATQIIQNAFLEDALFEGANDIVAINLPEGMTQVSVELSFKNPQLESRVKRDIHLDKLDALVEEVIQTVQEYSRSQGIELEQMAAQINSFIGGACSADEDCSGDGVTCISGVCNCQVMDGLVAEDMNCVPNPDKALKIADLMLQSDASIPEFLQWISINRRQLQYFGFNLQDMLSECKYNGRKCDERHFTQWTNQRYGNCYTFNSASHSRSPLRRTKFSGFESGLSLTLNQVVDLGLSLWSSPGFRVSIHHPNKVPFPEENGIDVMTTHNRQDIAVQVTELDNKYDKHEQNHWIWKGDYSTEACRKLCQDEIIQNVCECSTMITEIRDSEKNSGTFSRFCDARHATCLRENWDLIKNASCSHCIACHETSYSSRLVAKPHHTVYPFGDGDGCLTSGAESSTIKVNVFLESLDVKMMKNTPVLTKRELLTAAGCYLYMLLGLSIYFILQLFECLLKFTYRIIRRKCCGKPEQQVPQYTSVRIQYLSLASNMVHSVEVKNEVLEEEEQINEEQEQVQKPEEEETEVEIAIEEPHQKRQETAAVEPVDQIQCTVSVVTDMNQLEGMVDENELMQSFRQVTDEEAEKIMDQMKNDL